MSCLLLRGITFVVFSLRITWIAHGHSASVHSKNVNISLSLCLFTCSSMDINLQTREWCLKHCERGGIPGDANSGMSNVFRRNLLDFNKNKDCLGQHKPGLRPCVIKENKVYVDFKKETGDVKVSWEPLQDDWNCENWTSYALVYQKSGDQGLMECVFVPKNQTSKLISGYWSDPEELSLAVVSFPFTRGERFDLITLDPLQAERRAMPNFVPEFPTTVMPKIVASIAGGLSAGLVLISFLFGAVIWRKRNSSRQQGEVVGIAPEAIPSRPDTFSDIYYSCYYPESEAFRNRVASIVNNFRQNGYDVMMDVMASREMSSMGPSRWAERQIRNAKNILVFLSPGLVKLALDGCDGIHSQDINRVWIELEVLRDLYAYNRSAAKMVCITLSDFPVETRDLPLWAKVSYKWPADFQEILKRLNNRPSVLPV